MGIGNLNCCIFSASASHWTSALFFILEDRFLSVFILHHRNCHSIVKGIVQSFTHVCVKNFTYLQIKWARAKTVFPECILPLSAVVKMWLMITVSCCFSFSLVISSLSCSHCKWRGPGEPFEEFEWMNYPSCSLFEKANL